MKETFSIQQKTRQLFTILIPILVTQLTLFAMVFFDTMMSGKSSAVDLAGVAIGGGIWVPVSTGLNGILLAVTPIVAQLIGGNRRDLVSFKVIQAIYLSVAIAIIVIGLGAFLLDPILNTMNLDESVRKISKGYLTALAFGIIPSFVYTVFRCFIDALGQTRVSMIITLMSLPINVVLNYVLIFGKLGFPRLGGVGAGVATAITYWLIAIIAFSFIKRKEPFADFQIFIKLPRISIKVWKELIKIGVPIGFAIFFETAVFSGVTLLMSQYNTVTIAAHTVALNFASFVYMIPLSFSIALTILVGFEVGAKRYRDAKQYSYLGIGISIFLAVFTAIFLIVFREGVAGIYTNEMEVLMLAQHFLIFAIFFQLSDAIATPIQGVLRGYKDVNAPFILSFISFWVIGLPLGYLLATFTDIGPYGYWVGLISGLAFGAISLSIRLIRMQRKHATVLPKLER